MSIDEIGVLIVAVAGATYGWTRWYLALSAIWPPAQAKQSRFWLQLLPLISAASIFIILVTLASFDVVGDAVYTFFYVVLGLAWVVGVRDLFFLLFDLSWRDDAIERNNPAAVVAIFGAVLGATAIYAGSNIGDGPGWWVVVFTGGIATAMWLALLGVKQLTCSVFQRITVDRDFSASIRMSFYMLASGLIMGRSAAGDWISAERTIAEFSYAWPVLVLTAIAIVVDKVQSKDTNLAFMPDHQARDAWLWGVGYVVMAVGLIVLFPAMTQNPWYGR